MTKLELYLENEYLDWNLDTEKYEQIALQIFDYYLKTPEIFDNCCLQGFDYNKVSFDFLFTDSKKTHEINKEYRNKDYPADIITFAVFADSEPDEKFVLDFEINLGEIIIGLDKIIEEAEKKSITKEIELIFMMSHGILHLLGFDHQTEEEFQFVVDNQKRVLKSLGIDYDKI